MRDGRELDELIGMVRAAGRAPDASAARVVALEALRAEVESVLRGEVTRARGAGVTWAELGQALGVTRQAAFQRFGSNDTRRERKHVEQRLATAVADGRTVVDALKGGRFVEVIDRMSPELSDALPSERLETVWIGFLDSVGALENFREAASLIADGAAVAEFRLEFEAGSLTCRTAWNAGGELVGLFFVPTVG